MAETSVKIFGNSSLKDRISCFQSKVERHTESQKRNPFSNSNLLKSGVQNTNALLGISKDDPRYGRPPEGSKTEARGIKAGNHITHEIHELCGIIREYGLVQPDGSVLIEFGELFQMYTVISNKVVGLLLRARKHGLVEFPGEMLFQRRDDHVLIKLFPVVES